MEIDRKTYIGGSDCAAILGVSKWKTPFMLYQEKIGAYVEEVSPQKQKVFNRGKRWEPVVIEMLVDELESRGHEVKVLDRNRRFSDISNPWLKAEIDLELIIDGEEMNGEMKTVHPFAAGDWGEEGTDEIPVGYLAQVQHGLMVRPRRMCVVAALIGADDLRVHFVEADQTIIRSIRKKENEFWRRIQDLDAPDPETDADVSWLYPTGIIPGIDANNDIYDSVIDIIDIKRQYKQLEQQEESLKVKIKSFMGNSQDLLWNGKKILTWKNNKDSEKVDWEQLAISLHASKEQIKKYTDTIPGPRVFRLSK